MYPIYQFLSQFNIYDAFRVIVPTLFIIIGIIVYLLFMKINKIHQLKNSHRKLMRSFEELDEQAKLIVKTDLELNKTQEQLDKRLAGLNALQKTSRLISTTLDEDEIFRRLDRSLMTDLGFEKCFILMLDGNKNFVCRIQSGFSDGTVKQIIDYLTKDQSLNTGLKEGHSFSSVNLPKQKKEKISNLFGVEHFVLTPILTQDGFIGISFVGNQSGASVIGEGDEELISILANQIGQSLENAQLFEQVYKSRQELELKIQERTKQLASALEEVREISKTKSEFVSAVSHELRTPLTSIKGYASILISGKLGDIPAQVKDRLEKINKHSDNLVKFINELLDIARIESGRIELKFMKYNATSLIENIHDLLAPQMKEKSIQFKSKIPKDTPELLTDPSQIERVFINLLGNAIKFTPQNGTISVNVQPYQDHVLFEVSDTGIGIDKEDIPKLFSEFYRVENEINQNVKGTGLGLVLVKNIIEAHQGKIWATSKINQGTTFHFTLPLEVKKGETGEGIG